MNETPYPWIEFSLTIGTWDHVDIAYLDPASKVDSSSRPV
jgi:hypothetical protein